MIILLNEWDMKFMEDTVRSIVRGWYDSIKILSPLPLDQQPNYNKYMREFTGEVKYTIRVIPAEHKDLVNNQTNNIPPDEVEYGLKNAGILLYAIPDVLPIYKDGVQVGVERYRPTKHDIFIVDDSSDRYYLRSMRDRIGEVLITLHRFVGGTPSGIFDGTIDSNGMGGD